MFSVAVVVGLQTSLIKIKEINLQPTIACCFRLRWTRIDGCIIQFCTRFLIVRFNGIICLGGKKKKDLLHGRKLSPDLCGHVQIIYQLTFWNIMLIRFLMVVLFIQTLSFLIILSNHKYIYESSKYILKKAVVYESSKGY